MPAVVIPGMEVATSSAGAAALEVTNPHPNLWWLTFANDAQSPVQADAPSSAMPSDVLGDSPGTLAKVELDTCGTWVTLANAEATRPIVVRRAGWVDVRGHPFDANADLRDDRVGLGPGDALVFARTPSSDTTNDAFLDSLLNAPTDADALRDAALAASESLDAQVAVLRVPDDLGQDPRVRVATALGVPPDDLELPGYPLGDLQPELWSEPPRPPRLARVRLGTDTRVVRDIRALLDRLIASWRLTARLDENGLKLAASELATNAIRHTGEPETATVRYFGQGVRVEVDDRSPVEPVLRDVDADEIGGRGLRVVDAVASSWGVEARPSGKRVWCEIGLQPDA